MCREPEYHDEDGGVNPVGRNDRTGRWDLGTEYWPEDIKHKLREPIEPT
jgi:hypothetical protein